MLERMTAGGSSQHNLMMCCVVQVGEEALLATTLRGCLHLLGSLPLPGCRLEQSKGHHEPPWLSAKPQAGHH